jgi:dipeptidyl aminopeptidase/acylaminoacyl peptidase
MKLLRMGFFGSVLGLLALSVQAEGVSFSDLARHEQYREVKISPDGRHLAAVAVIKDRPVLALVDLQTGGGAAVYPRDGDQVVELWWVNPNRVIYTVGQKVDGFDRPFATGELFAVNADGHGAATLFGYRAGTQSTGSLVQHATAEYASASLIDTLRDDENHVLVGISPWSTGAEGAFTEVDRMDVRDGTRHRVAMAPLRNASFLVDHRGVVRFAYGSNSNAKEEVYYRADERAPWSLLFTEGAHGAPMPVVFDQDDARVFVSCDRAGAVAAICPWDVATGKLLGPIWSSPAVAPDALELSLDHQQVVGVDYMPGMPAISALVPGSDTLKIISAFSRQFPGEFADVVSSTDDGKKAVVLVSSDVDPGTYYLWDAEAGKAHVLLQRASWIKPEDMARMQPVEFEARDGVPLRGYLTRPPGQEDASHLPMVVFVHGGPFGVRDTWAFDPYVQMLATHGYAVLQVNYRGSGGYGFGFERAGYRQWGGRMQDDVTDATRWAVAQGIADPARMCIFGGSYGGYAALEGAIKEPDLYRCAIGYVGVYDLGLMYRRGDIPQSIAGKNYLHDALGDDMSVLDSRSPVRQLDHLKAQVMLVVGGEDKRVPPVQGENLHRALLQRGIAHEWIYKSDEGHGFYAEGNRAELFARIVAFLDRNIGQTQVAAH